MDCWLMKGSKAKELYDLWQDAKDPKSKQLARKKLDQHMSQLEENQKALENA